MRLSPRSFAVLLTLGVLAGCVPLENLNRPRPPRPGGGQQGGGQPGSGQQGGGAGGPLPVYTEAPDARPVVVTGDALDALRGSDPGDVVAFAFANGRFRQVPVQVDERFVYDIGVAYEGLNPRDCAQPAWCREVQGQVRLLGYADAGTHVGADPDAGLDDDDEVALMLADFGGRAAGSPDGVDPGSGVELAATADGETRYAYLYRRLDARLDPDAGTPYVRYAPLFERGAYRQNYDRGGRRPGPARDLVRVPDASNPENTTLRTSFYEIGFAERWIMDRLEIEGGPDILDVDMLGFVPGDCVRTPFTGSLSEGGFLVNKSGPIRAIRRVVGFNSAPLNEMQWVFYQRYAESHATLRVHPIPGVSVYLDHSAEAEGMTYRDAATDGVAVDGRPDRVSTAPPTWQMLTGRQGSYVVDFEIASSGFRLPPVETVYEDDANPPVPTCLLDDAWYGAHGVRIAGEMPRTDPRGPGAEGEFAARRRFVFGGDPNEGLRALQSSVRVSARPAS